MVKDPDFFDHGNSKDGIARKPGTRNIPTGGQCATKRIYRRPVIQAQDDDIVDILDSKEDIRTYEVAEQGSERTHRKYRKDPTMPRKAIELLAHGYAAEHVARQLDVSPSQISRYAKEAERLRIIVHHAGERPRIYDPGPFYSLRKEKGWWSHKFEPVWCRVHRGQGNPYTWEAESVGNFESLPFRQPDGTVKHVPLFTATAHFGKGYTLHKARLGIPSDVLGYEGSAGLVVYLKNDGSASLQINPPTLALTFQVLESKASEDPFDDVLFYIDQVFMFNGHWDFVGWKSGGYVHYAVDLRAVKNLCPELLMGVPSLKKADNEEDLELFLDRSISPRELETVHQRIARDILGILEVERRLRNGTLTFEGCSL